MRLLTILYALTIIGFLIYTVRAIDWHDRRGRTVINLMLAAVSFSAYMVMSDLLGRPRPADWAPAEQGQLIAYVMDRDNIWIWVKFPDDRQPIAIEMPWTRKQAKGLYDIEDELNGRGVALKRGKSEGEWMFYPMPHKESPPKVVE